MIIDGAPRQAFNINEARPDFCAAQNVRGCPRVGFLLNIDVTATRLAPGEHTLQIRATSSRGAIETVPQQPVRFTVESGQSRVPQGAIETPAAGATLSAITPIRGWVYANGLRVVTVDVIINGVTYGQAQYGVQKRRHLRNADRSPA